MTAWRRRGARRRRACGSSVSASTTTAPLRRAALAAARRRVHAYRKLFEAGHAAIARMAGGPGSGAGLHVAVPGAGPRRPLAHERHRPGRSGPADHPRRSLRRAIDRARAGCRAAGPRCRAVRRRTGPRLPRWVRRHAAGAADLAGGSRPRDRPRSWCPAWRRPGPRLPGGCRRSGGRGHVGGDRRTRWTSSAGSCRRTRPAGGSRIGSGRSTSCACRAPCRGRSSGRRRAVLAGLRVYQGRTTRLPSCGRPPMQPTGHPRVAHGRLVGRTEADVSRRSGIARRRGPTTAPSSRSSGSGPNSASPHTGRPIA